MQEMTRHGKNSTASAVYSYSERKKDAKQSGYGTLHERLSADSIKQFDCCSITLQPCRDPVISPYGYIFDREAVLEYYLQQKKENARKLKEWEKQCKRDEEDAEKRRRIEEEVKLKKFVACESTPAHPTLQPDSVEPEAPTTSAGATASGSRIGQKRRVSDEIDEALKRKKQEESISNVAGSKRNENPSFWVPQLIPTAEGPKLEKPDQRVICPMSGRPLKIKELMPVKFTKIADGDEATKWIAKKVRYMCPVTHDALTNTTRCAYLKTSQTVVTMSCVEQIIRKDMVDPINGAKMTEDDIIELQRGGTEVGRWASEEDRVYKQEQSGPRSVGLLSLAMSGRILSERRAQFIFKKFSRSMRDFPEEVFVTGFAATNKVKAKLVRPQLELQ